MTDQLQLKICVDYKNESKAVKSFVDLISYQASIGSQDVKIIPSTHQSAVTADFFLGKIAVSNIVSRKRNVLLSDSPYSSEFVNFHTWRNNLDRIHQSLCNTQKIIVTNDDVKNSLLLKHSQDVFKVQMPITVEIFQHHNLRRKENICIVVSQDFSIPLNLINVLKKSRIQYDVIRFSQGQVVDIKDLIKITSFSEVFWLDDLDLKYSNQILNPISLSLSGIKVVVNDLSLTGTLNGMTVSEWIAQKGRSASIFSMAKQMAKEYLSSPNYSVTSFLKTHLD